MSIKARHQRAHTLVRGIIDPRTRFEALLEDLALVQTNGRAFWL